MKSRVRKSKKTYSSRSGKVVFGIFLVILLVFGGFFGFKYFRINSSAEFQLDKVSIYYIKTESEGALVITDVNKRMVKIVNVPNSLYIDSLRYSFSGENYTMHLQNLLRFVDIERDYDYFVFLRKDILDSFGVSNLKGFFGLLSKRGLKFTDYLALEKFVSNTRPASSLTVPAAAKLFKVFGQYAVNEYSLPTLTAKPMMITVDGNTYIRTYLDEEQIKSFLEKLKN